MFYLGIDLHRKQMTVSLRNEHGDVVLRRQVSTRPKKVEEFLVQVHQQGPGDDASYVGILEVCGFHDWLVRLGVLQRALPECKIGGVIIQACIASARRATNGSPDSLAFTPELPNIGCAGIKNPERAR